MSCRPKSRSHHCVRNWIGVLATMKIFQDTMDARSDRKLIKSQMEKRRRGRINRSLEHLRTMLLQEPPQMGGAQHRVEKAEILEQTVLFLRGSVGGDDTSAKGGGGGQKHSFQDGFATCMQRAAQFLGPEGKGLRLGAALDASFAARVASSDSGFQRRTDDRFPSSSLSHTKFILQMLRQKSKYRQHPPASGSVCPFQVSEHQRFPTGQQEHQGQNMLDIKSQGSKQSPSQSHPATHTLWRPWP